MHVTGVYNGAQFSLNGDLILSFLINEKDKAFDEIHGIKDVAKLKIDVVKYRERRSLTANGYFWQLVDKMAKRLFSDKWTVYLLQLSKYGVFTDLAIVDEALPLLQRQFRYTEVLREIDVVGKPGKIVRCYIGSSTYNTKEMSDLIDGTVQEAKSLGIETMTPDEIKALIAAWKGDTNGLQHSY